MSELYVFINGEFDGKAVNAIIADKTVKFEGYVPKFPRVNQLQLNDNQKIVLDWMKEKTIEENHGFEFALWWTLDAFGTDEPVVHELEVFRNMNSIQRKEVLVAFIAWVQEQEEADE